MLVLIVFIICSAMFYLYYKAKNVRTNRVSREKILVGEIQYGTWLLCPALRCESIIFKPLVTRICHRIYFCCRRYRQYVGWV